MSTVVVLDMDGTLLDLGLDSERVRGEIERTLRDAGVERRLRPLLATLESTLTEVARADAARAQALRRAAWAIIDAEETRAAATARARPGAGELLRALAGVPVALFTNNHRAAVDRALAAAGLDAGAFFAIEARGGPEPIKPSAAPLERLLAHPAARGARRVLVVGDHESDVASAAALAAAGGGREVLAIGVPRDVAHGQRLEAAGAGFIVAALDEVADFARCPPFAGSLSLVLLAFNEEASIAAAVADARRFCAHFAPRYQIVVVDDGSRDATAERLAGVAGPDLTVVTHPTNLGMGASMRDGYRAATEDYLAHLPGDRQVRPQALLRFLPRATPERTVVSRYAAPPSGAARVALSLAFRALVVGVGGLRVDFAGTYLFHRRWLEAVPLDALVSNTFLLSFELLEGMRRHGCAFERVVVHPFPRTDGPSREVGVGRIARVFREIVAYRLRARR